MAADRTFEPFAVKTQDAAGLVREVIIPAFKQTALYSQIFPPTGRGDDDDDDETHAWATKSLETSVAHKQSIQHQLKYRLDEDSEGVAHHAAFIRCELHHLSDAREEARWACERMRQAGGGLPYFEDVVGFPDALDLESFAQLGLWLKHKRDEVIGGREDVFCLQQLFVRPECQGIGLARQLVEWMVGVADEEGWACYAMVPSRMEKLFTRWGFRWMKRSLHWGTSGPFVCLLREARGQAEVGRRK